MIGIYLSETGVIPLECTSIIEEIRNNDTIILGDPIPFSNTPFMVRDFINKNKFLWHGKKILCVATMGAFSGDGAEAASFNSPDGPLPHRSES